MNSKHLFVILLSIQVSLTGLKAGVVTTSPEHENHEIIIAKDESVTFTATPDSGDVTATLDVDPPGPQVAGSGSTQTATFSAGTEGQAYTCTFAVTHTDGDETCADGQEFTYTVYVPKIEGVGNTDEIWWWDGENQASPYENKRTLQATGLPSNKTITWKLNGQTDVVNFGNNQETITGTDQSREIHTVGYSSNEYNLYVELELDGKTVASTEDDKFTARTVASTPNTHADSNPPPAPYVWETIYTMTAKDKFGQEVPNIDVCELFNPAAAWAQDSSNWIRPGTYGNGQTDGAAKFRDFYKPNQSITLSPTAVSAGSSGSGTPTLHTNQKYLFGGTSSNPGFNATGQEAESHTIQFFRGKARQL
ncbi:MAG: hypothetical protein M0Q93_04115 [Terrimicrobiaceae bacterium]|jgi:hypothetical protein|nr:hypothetical protein [Terrimicrobiaceae bacterium]